MVLRHDESEGRFARGWRLALESWRVIRGDPQLLWLPILSAATTVLAAVLVLGPVLWWAQDQGSDWPYGVAIVLGAYVLNFVGTFFGVAFVAAVGQSLRNEPVDLGAALRQAVRRIGPIAAWSLAATAVEILLRALERVRGGFLVNVAVRWVLGAAWALATLFVVPVIAIEGVGPVEAARRSIAVVRKRWGEGVAGSAAIGGFFLLVFVPAILLAVAGIDLYDSSPVLGGALVAVAAVLIVLGLTLQWAMTNVFRLALYRYAVDGEVSGPFTTRDLEQSVRPRGGLFRN
jgi:hypothetical protein